MSRTVPQFLALLQTSGSDVIFHRESGGTPCPCRTDEGFRDPAWHAANLSAPNCNEEGYLNPIVTDLLVKAVVQPVTGGQRFRVAERVNSLLGEVEVDDHLGIFPVKWGNMTLDFSGWSDAGEDYIEYDNRRFMVVAVDKVPDIDGDPDHHYELGLRLLTGARV